MEVPNLVGNTYHKAARRLGNQCMGIEVLGTAPPGGSWDSNWTVSLQNVAGGTEVDPVPLGYVVGVILILPAVP